MSISDNGVMKSIRDSLRKNSEFEFIATLEDLTIEDLDYIKELFTANNNGDKITYQIVDNAYIKIDYLKNEYINCLN
jgi:hypothetical protein